jgi:hypothetical protein
MSETLERQPYMERIQQEVQEVADVLSRQSGRTILEVWDEALSLHRVRYSTEILPDEDRSNKTS